MEEKTTPLIAADLKAAGDGWMIEGYASTWSITPDSSGDVVRRGAFAATIASGRTIKLLWQHDAAKPIGVPLELKEDAYGLFGRWRIPQTAQGREAREYVRAQLVDGLSIGFYTIKAEDLGGGVRALIEADLREVSLVTMPANESALLTGWKSGGPRPRTPAASAALRRDLGDLIIASRLDEARTRYVARQLAARRRGH